mgnify:CR=1 FL=1|jgi:hypothetical protein
MPYQMPQRPQTQTVKKPSFWGSVLGGLVNQIPVVGGYLGNQIATGLADEEEIRIQQQAAQGLMGGGGYQPYMVQRR